MSSVQPGGDRNRREALPACSVQDLPDRLSNISHDERLHDKCPYTHAQSFFLIHLPAKTSAYDDRNIRSYSHKFFSQVLSCHVGFMFSGTRAVLSTQLGFYSRSYFFHRKGLFYILSSTQLLSILDTICF